MAKGIDANKAPNFPARIRKSDYYTREIHGNIFSSLCGAVQDVFYSGLTEH